MKNKSRFICLALIVVTGLGMPLTALAKKIQNQDQLVRVGVLAIRGKAAATKSWEATAAHLSGTIEGYRFQMVPLNLEEMERAVKDDALDFIITNTGQYIKLESKYSVSKLATLRNVKQGLPFSKFGAVIFTRADRDDINTLSDLKNHSFMAVEENAFGGFEMAWYEFFKKGIDPFSDFSKLQFSGFPQDQIPLAVLHGEVDAGTVRTDVLEGMARSGSFRLDQFKVLNQQQIKNFPFLLSTDLYPEWPFSKCHNTDLDLAKQVQLALLIMGENSPAARAAKSAGWTVALDYSAATRMMKELNIGPFRDPRKSGVWEFLYKYWTIILLFGLVSVPPFWVYVIRLYVNSRVLDRRRQQAELEWLQGMDLMADPTILLDLDDRIIRANRVFYERIRKKPEEAIGHTVTEFFHPDGEDVPCKICRARQEKKDVTLVIEADEPPNHLGCPMEITLRVVRDGNGNPVRIIQSMRDLTETRARQEELEDQNKILQQLVQGTSRTTGEAYFHELVRNLAQTLEVEFAFTAELLDQCEIKRARAFAIWGNNEFLEPIEYDLSGTPCETVLRKNVSYFGDDLQKLFPGAPLLSQLSIRSYLGVPFFDTRGKPLGHVAIMDVKPLENEQRLSAIMQIFADRVGAEYERRMAHRALEESERRFKGLFETSPDAAVIADEDGAIQYVNSKFEEQFGYDREEIIGQPVEVLLPEEFREHHPGMRAAYTARPAIREMGSRTELMAMRKDGSEFYAEISLSPMQTKDGLFVTATIRDVSARQQAERELERLASFPMMSPIPVMEVDMLGNITYENPVSAKLFPELTKQGFDHPLLQNIDEYLVDLKNGLRSVVRDVKVGGAIYEQQLSYIGETNQLRIYSWDVTNLHEMTKQMAYQASHDALTGLLNRREFEQHLERAIQSSVFDDRLHALCYIDLDQFKIVNDTCGHIAGDELLRQLTSLLRKHVRDSDSLARLGGDEFGLLFIGCPMDRASELADHLRQVISEFVFVWEAQSFKVGASIGLVEINRSSGSLAEVLSAADSACYAAKELGRNRLYTYHPNDAVLSRNVSEMNWTHRIRHALDRDEFLLYYQTIESLSNPEELHCEILLRLIDTDGATILPGAFIPAAERFGLMAEIDKWVVDHSLEVIRNGEYDFKSYSINLSGQTLGNPSIMNAIVDDIAKSDINPELICFEITETAMITNLTSAEKYIKTIRDMGCKFALDDFGTGLSSFSYLKSLPVDRLKIDSHFIRDIVRDEINSTMVMSINVVGHSMNLLTVAEGVEDKRILSALKKIGIDYAQGYALSRPVPFAGQPYTMSESIEAGNG
jgi:diguanylate cyclase (GGDEF)-like protein/PAS domain S-box-containing protein